jgi:hypothetical protein
MPIPQQKYSHLIMFYYLYEYTFISINISAHSSNLSLVSIIFYEEMFLPVCFAGQDEVHLPHSVQV